MPNKKQKSEIVGRKIQSVPKDKPVIGIDTDNNMANTVLDAINSSSLDLGQIESFTSVAQGRDNIYSTADTMAQDSTIAAILKTYTSDITAPNDAGQRVWVEAKDPTIAKYCNYLIDNLNINENLYDWVYSLLKYGDLYIKLYRQSDIEQASNTTFSVDGKNSIEPKATKSLQEVFNQALEAVKKDEKLDSKAREALSKANKEVNEALKLKLDSQNSKLVHFIEKYPNPAEIFDLTQFGKTEGFIKAPVISTAPYDTNNSPLLNYLRYDYKQRDVTFYNPTEFVHAYLSDNSGRVPEKVNISLDKTTAANNDSISLIYTVKRGSSVLTDKFKIWRQLSLLENALLLSRVTRSALVRILNVNIGDMGKDSASAFIDRLKAKIEQKSALNTNVGMAEYANPGPIENIIYIPTHGDQGTITANVLGGDYDPKQLTDLEYYRDKFFGAFGIPKQFFGFTGDGAGFNGGASLSIISSIYAKDVIRYQCIVCDFVKNLLNVFLLDQKLLNSLNNFQVKMQPPVTQDDIDRRQNNDSRVRYVSEVLNILGQDISQVASLKIKKSLLNPIVNDPEVMAIIDDEIEKLEETENADELESSTPDVPSKPNNEESKPLPRRKQQDNEATNNQPELPIENEQEVGEQESDYLPSFSDLNMSGIENK